MSSFIDRFLNGKVANPMVDVSVEIAAWLESNSAVPLSQWLGMTKLEYESFIEDPQAFFDALPDTWWRSCIVTREQARERLDAIERELAARIGIPPVEFSIIAFGTSGSLVAICAANQLMHILPPETSWLDVCELAAQLERSHLGGTLTDIIRRMILAGSLLEDSIWNEAGRDLVAEWHSAYSWYLSYDRDDEPFTAAPVAPAVEGGLDASQATTSEAAAPRLPVL